jgi:hypothetical protein
LFSSGPKWHPIPHLGPTGLKCFLPFLIVSALHPVPLSSPPPIPERKRGSRRGIQLHTLTLSSELSTPLWLLETDLPAQADPMPDTLFPLTPQL